MNGVTSSGAVWYLMRGSGVVSLLLLTTVLALGVATAGRLPLGRLPRFVTLSLHRSLALLAVVFLGIHVLTAVVDPYAGVGVAAVAIPFLATRSAFWTGLGALSLDIVAALIVTSLVRRRLPARLWRGVHWLAYAAWPVALLHGIGGGTDSREPWMLAATGAACGVVGAAVLWRLTSGRARGPAAAGGQLA